MSGFEWTSPFRTMRSAWNARAASKSPDDVRRGKPAARRRPIGGHRPGHHHLLQERRGRTHLQHPRVGVGEEREVAGNQAVEVPAQPGAGVRAGLAGRRGHGWTRVRRIMANMAQRDMIGSGNSRSNVARSRWKTIHGRAPLAEVSLPPSANCRAVEAASSGRRSRVRGCASQCFSRARTSTPRPRRRNPPPTGPLPGVAGTTRSFSLSPSSKGIWARNPKSRSALVVSRLRRGCPSGLKCPTEFRP